MLHSKPWKVEMTLTGFVDNLLENGSVTVAGRLAEFAEPDRQGAIAVLQNYYNEDSLEMPGTAPAFSAGAALWAAEFLYHAIQLTMLRDLDDEAVEAQLGDLPEPVTPESIYSADLCFRYLPDLLELAKGLAPGDVLVKRIKETLNRWPFSSVGIELAEEPDHMLIMNHPSLRAAYIDRIIKQKDIKRVKNNTQLMEPVITALGSYPDAFWPELQLHVKID
jgi:hypothetical protein